MIGRTYNPDYMTHCVQKESITDSFPINFYPKNNLDNVGKTQHPIVHALASDGTFLYLQTSAGLFKVGSGYNGTMKGYTYLHNPSFCSDAGWLGHVNGQLYFRSFTTPSEEGGAVGGKSVAFSDPQYEEE